MTAPREESIIAADLRKLDAELAEVEPAGKRFATIRKTLESALVAAQRASLDTGATWSPPKWSGDVRWHDPERAVEGLRACLLALDVVLSEGGGTEYGIPIALYNLDPDIATRKPYRPGKAEDLRERRAELRAELALRRKGPGERRPYRLLRGSHTRIEAGTPRRYRAGAEIAFDDWEVLKYGPDRLAPAEAQTA